MIYTHFVLVAAQVINEDRDILLIKSPLRGWEYPGGMVEPGETFPLTRKRMENMLSGNEKVSCFGFKKEPFEVIVEECFRVGKLL